MKSVFKIKMPIAPNDKIAIYRAPDGKLSLEVKLDRETFWLSLKDIAELFGKDKSVISRHLKNIFSSRELKKSSVVAKNATVQIEGNRKIAREIEFYNLDAIISVGYRVNSKRATQFRQWATQTLREHIVKGFTVNPNRLTQIPTAYLKEFEQAVALVESARQKKLSLDESDGLLEVITNYAKTWLLLEQYDKQILTSEGKKKSGKSLKIETARAAVAELKRKLLAKKQASEIFGRERDATFAGILGNIEQSFDGKYLYPTLESKAAHLLYFLVKDHPFSDGNKRIGAFLFIFYLARNNFLITKNGKHKLNDNALVALTLLIAESHPQQKKAMIALTINLIRSKIG